MCEREDAHPWEAEDDDESYLDFGWEPDSEKVERILKAFRFDPLSATTLQSLKDRLDDAEVEFRKIIGEYDAERDCGVLRVILADGREISI
jgi:hypothetical protein